MWRCVCVRFIIGSEEALPILCVRYIWWERERERERERRKWRHHCRAKIGDEFTLSLAKNSHLAMSLHFPLPKIRTFRFSLHTSHLTLLMVTIVALIRWVLTFRCQKNFASLFRLSQVARLFFPSKKWIKLYQKLLEIEKEIVREVALGDKHHPRKSADRKAPIRKAFVSLTGLICALRSADFLGWCLSPSATSRTISFSISNSFWY